MMRGLLCSLFFTLAALSCRASSPIEAPVALSVESGFSSHFVLSWEDRSDNEDGFVIERQTFDDVWRAIGSVPANQTRFLSAGCYHRNAYRHRVAAFNDSGRSNWLETREPSAVSAPEKSEQGHIIEKSMPRQSEGTFLRDVHGTLHFYYSSFTGRGDKDRGRIAVKTSSDNGASWSEQKIVFDQPQRSPSEYPEYEDEGWHLLLPQAVRLPNDDLCLSYAKMVPGSWIAHRVFRISKDEGESWSRESLLTDGVYDYLTGSSDRIYRLSNGRVISLVHGRNIEVDRGLRTLVYYLDPEDADEPEGKWKRASGERFVPERIAWGEYGFWEASLVEFAPGQLLMYARTATGWFYESRSSDYGTNWTEPRKTNVVAPQTPASLNLIPETKQIVLVWNPYFDAQPWNLGDRFVLASMVTNDLGKTWSHYKELEHVSEDRWYMYPFLHFEEGLAHIGYDVGLIQPNTKKWERRELMYHRLPWSWFTE